MQPARVLAEGIHVLGIVGLLGAVGTGGGIGPVVGVESPAVGRVHRLRRVLQGVQALPVRSRVRAVDRLGVIETVVAHRDELRVQIGDLALGAGEQGVVRRIGLQLGHLHEAGVVGGLGAQERLLQGRDRLVHQGDADPLAAFLADDGAAMRLVDGEAFLSWNPVVAQVRHGDHLALQRAQFVAVLVEALAVLLDDGLGELVDHIDAAGGMHPAGLGVEALVDEELAPGRGAVGVETLVAGDLHLRTEEEAGVRVDQQQGLAVQRQLRRDGDAVRARRLLEQQTLLVGGHGDLPLAVEGFQLAQGHALDVAADAAFREAERHPGFEALDDLRLHVRVGGQVVVQPVGPAVHQSLQPGRTPGVLGLQHNRVDEQLLAQIGKDRRQSLRLGRAAQRGHVVGLDAVEVVLGLGIGHAEHRVGVGLAVDVGDAPVVAGDRYLGCLGLQARQVALAFRGRERRRCGENGGGDQSQDTDGKTHATSRALRGPRMVVRCRGNIAERQDGEARRAKTAKLGGEAAPVIAAGSP